LLAALGDPPLWSASLCWAQLHAALIAEQWAEAGRQAEALEAAAAPGPERDHPAPGRYVVALAVAARQWLAVLRGTVQPAAVESAARALHAVGLSWEAGRLAGQAAIRTTDRKAMSGLLQCARGFQATELPVAADPVTAGRPEPSPAGPAAAPPGSRPADRVEPGASGPLSEREVEVATLMLEGLTYKEIGERLFISAKTVEHHVARMRQRLGAVTRSELLARLRVIVSG
jgi:DNA-binding CsgD family transcriptional regulator